MAIYQLADLTCCSEALLVFGGKRKCGKFILGYPAVCRIERGMPLKTGCPPTAEKRGVQVAYCANRACRRFGDVRLSQSSSFGVADAVNMVWRKTWLWEPVIPQEASLTPPG